MPNDSYDDLFDSWGKALNVNPQIVKTLFHVECGGNPNCPDGPLSPSAPIGPDGRRERAQGGMQIMPSTAAAMARKLGFDPRAVNLHDMGWAIPLATQYVADGLNATNTTEGAMAYYYTGRTDDPSKWSPATRAYVAKAQKTYPNMALTPVQPPTAPPPDQTAAAQPAELPERQ